MKSTGHLFNSASVYCNVLCTEAYSNGYCSLRLCAHYASPARSPEQVHRKRLEPWMTRSTHVRRRPAGHNGKDVTIKVDSVLANLCLHHLQVKPANTQKMRSFLFRAHRGEEAACRSYGQRCWRSYVEG
eukprot:1146340-Pelagomonas_calceolata.AAC.6